MKRLLIGILVVISILSIGLVAMAGQPSAQPPEPTIGVRSSDPYQGRIDISAVQTAGVQSATADLIAHYGCEVFNPRNGTASMTGYTDLFEICSEVRVTIYLQWWDGSGWVDVASNSRTDYNASYTAVGKDTPSPQGYYRTRAVHYAKDAAGSELRYSESPFIFVQ